MASARSECSARQVPSSASANHPSNFRNTGAMKPEEAVAVFNNLEDEQVVLILSRMEEEAAAKVLASLEPKRAARLTQAMIKRK